MAMDFLLATTGWAQHRGLLSHESFDGNDFPTGWTTAGMSASNWEITNSNNAGGSPREVHLWSAPMFDGTTRLVTPAIDLTGLTSVTFSFKHYIEHYSQHIDLGHPNVQFCIFVDGNSMFFNQWYFDDVLIESTNQLDLGVVGLGMPSILPYGSNHLVVKTVNYGMSDVTSVEASYEIDGQAPVVETFPTHVANLEECVLTFNTPIDLDLGVHACTVRLLKVNGSTTDDNMDNNVFDGSFEVAIAVGERNVLLESFSSATCGPCVVNNQALQQLCDANEGQFAFVKYPTFGDAYNNAESDTRFNYYNVPGVPYLFLDGEDYGYHPLQQSSFDQQRDEFSLFDIRGSFAMNGSHISVKADVMPYIDTNARVFVSVNEKETHNNTGSNGETEFHHVMMKMLPSASGTQVSFATGEMRHFDFEYDMSSTHVEQMNDLEVAIWVQNYGTKEVFNSRFAYEYTVNHPYAVENLKVDPIEGVDCHCYRASWEAPSQGNPAGYDVFVNHALVAEKISDTYYEFEINPDKLYVVEVQAVYAGGLSSLKQLSTILEDVSVNENTVEEIMLYPNPVSDKLTVEALKPRFDIEIFNLTGELVYSQKDCVNPTVIDISGLSEGFYFIKMTADRSTLTRKFIKQ